jgi:hypothetical protein
MGADVHCTVGDEVRTLRMRNGAYSVLHQVLSLAGSRLATNDAERYWVLWIASHDLNSYGHNFASYDVAQMPWEVSAPEFLLRTIDGALARLGWDRL